MCVEAMRSSLLDKILEAHCVCMQAQQQCCATTGALLFTRCLQDQLQNPDLWQQVGRSEGPLLPPHPYP